MPSLIRRAVLNLRSNFTGNRYLSTSGSKSTGLYGFHQLKSPQGFQRFVDDAIERSGELVDYISGMPSSKEILKAMDEISDAVCTVLDSTTLCRQTHPDREFVQEATKAIMRMNEYLHFLNTNQSLYNAVVKAEQDKYLPTLEDKRAAAHLRFDLEKGGVHLCSDKLDRVNKLNKDISQLCIEFSENIDKDPGHVDVPASVIPKRVHHLMKPIKRYRSLGSIRENREKEFRIVTGESTLHTILQHVPDDEVVLVSCLS